MPEVLFLFLTRCGGRRWESAENPLLPPPSVIQLPLASSTSDTPLAIADAGGNVVGNVVSMRNFRHTETTGAELKLSTGDTIRVVIHVYREA